MATLTTENILEKILPWLSDKVQNTGLEITPVTDLISDNLIDSMEFLELVSYLEETFNIELDPDVLTPENFSTPMDVATLVEKYLDGT